MKAMILAGGFGTRISEETSAIPKPLVAIGDRPIIWHIMKLYSFYGINDFVICCGYKGHLIKRYFINYWNDNADMTVDMSSNSIEIHRSAREPWRVSLVDTGDETMTGGRIRRARDYVEGEAFCLTYGDGLSNIDIRALIEFHFAQKTLATVTAVAQPGRFGALDLSSDSPRVAGFREKSAEDVGLINGGFFVLEPAVIDLITGDKTVWEQEPMRELVSNGSLAVYRHQGYWQNMDTLRDKVVLQNLWDSGAAPWCVWEDRVRPAKA